MEKTLQNVIKEVFIKSFRTQKRKSSDSLLFFSTDLLDHSMTKYLKAEQLQLWQQY